MSSSMILLLVLMIATLIVLVFGIGTMFVGGEFNKRHGNKLMVARVTLQAITIAFVALLFFASALSHP